MSNVNSVGSHLSSYLYTSLSSGSRINNASNDASGLAILQKQEREVGGYQAGTQNIQSAKSAANIADGGLSQITDSLQRIRELGVQASNGLLSSEDKSYLQAEVDQLKQGIDDISKNTSYNGVSLLDNEDGRVLAFASDANGTERSLSAVNGTLDALGIADFDVTGDFDLKAIDKALNTLSNSQAAIGAQSNSFDVAIHYNNTVSYNTVSAQSRTGDTDYGDYIQRLKKEQTLNEVQLQMQKNRQEDERRNKLGLFQ